MISARVMLLGLVAANLVALGWWSGALDPFSGGEREPGRLERQIEPERLRVLPPGEARNGVSWAPEETRASVMWPGRESAPQQVPDPDAAGERTEPSMVALSSVGSSTDALLGLAGSSPSVVVADPSPVADDGPLTPPAIDADAGPACLEFADARFDVAEGLREEFIGLGAEVDLERLDAGRYLVFLPPLASEDAARAEAASLRRKGVRDLHVITAGYYRNAIGLGILVTAERAEVHRRQLTALGLDGVRIGPVLPADSRYRVKVHAPAARGKVRDLIVAAGFSPTDCPILARR